MILKTKGIPQNIHKPIVGKVSRDCFSKEKNTILILEHSAPIDDFSSFIAILSDKNDFYSTMPRVSGVKTFEHLSDGDIVVVNPDGIINTLYRIHSFQNFILVTERCNSNCIMCSQPPKDRNDIHYLFNIYKKLIPLIPKNCPEIGITGGEPTLLGELFFELLYLINKELPDTDIHCLTNGRTFAWEHIAHRLGEMNLRKLMLGIPLYSDYYQTHDYIVQAKGAFNQTMLGLYNLALWDQRIEIRIVLHKQSIPRLTKLSKFIYKNLPFVEHIAFMGLEYQGYTPHNFKKLWIDPVDYMTELEEAVCFLSDRGLNVSIYNLQLCLMPEKLWKFSKRSISDWKNIYLKECSECIIRKQCGGLFASTREKHSNYIKAFK